MSGLTYWEGAVMATNEHDDRHDDCPICEGELLERVCDSLLFY